MNAGMVQHVSNAQGYTQGVKKMVVLSIAIAIRGGSCFVVVVF